MKTQNSFVLFLNFFRQNSHISRWCWFRIEHKIISPEKSFITTRVCWNIPSSADNFYAIRIHLSLQIQQFARFLYSEFLKQTLIFLVFSVLLLSLCCASTVPQIFSAYKMFLWRHYSLDSTSKVITHVGDCDLSRFDPSGFHHVLYGRYLEFFKHMLLIRRTGYKSGNFLGSTHTIHGCTKFYVQSRRFTIAWRKRRKS